MDVFSGLSGEKDTVFAAPAPLALLIPKYLETTPLMYYCACVAMLALVLIAGSHVHGWPLLLDPRSIDR